MFHYRGVFAPEPPPLVSPNGDGVDDTQTFATGSSGRRP